MHTAVTDATTVSLDQLHNPILWPVNTMVHKITIDFSTFMREFPNKHEAILASLWMNFACIQSRTV